MILPKDLGRDLGYLCCGFFPEQTRLSPAIYLPLSGEGLLSMAGEEGEREYPLRAGQAFFSLPGQRAELLSQGEGFRLGWITLKGELLETLLAQLGLGEGRQMLFYRNVAGAAYCLEGLARQTQSLGETFLQMGLFYQLLGFLCEGEGPEGEEQRERGYVQQAMALLRGSCQEGIQISEVASRIGISRSYLSAIFKREMGVSPQKYLMDYRMEEAVRLLRETKEPIKSVGARVGYADYLSFSKAFHRRFGKSASAFREEPDFVLSREEDENTKSASEPDRQSRNLSSYRSQKREGESP